MPNNKAPIGLIAKKLRDKEYRKRHAERFDAFRLEAQILSILESKGWSYSDLAKATNTSKSNISRDLKAGGIANARLSRIVKIASALGYKYLSLLLPSDRARALIERIEKVVTESSGIVEQTGQPVNLMEASAASNVIKFGESESAGWTHNYTDPLMAR